MITIRRIGNLALRRDNKTGAHEICLFYDNAFYGKESEYIKNGEYYRKENQPFIRVHENCFELMDIQLENLFGKHFNGLHYEDITKEMIMNLAVEYANIKVEEEKQTIREYLNGEGQPW